MFSLSVGVASELDAQAIYAEEHLVWEAPPLGLHGPTRDWIVRQGGGTPLNTTEVLRLLDDPDPWRRFERRQSADLALGVGLATLGSVGMHVGYGLWVVGLESRLQTYPVGGERAHAIGLEQVGLGVMGASLVSGALSLVPITSRSRRARRPDVFFRPDEMDAHVRMYNDRLALELSEVSPAPVQPPRQAGPESLIRPISPLR